MALIKTSRTRNSNNSLGFTLIEILVVMIIIAFIVTLGARKLQSPNTTIKKAVRQIATVTRELHVRSKLSGITFRLALEMNGKKPDKIWVEASTKKITLPTEKDLKEQQNARRSDKKEESPFALDKRIGTGGIRELPSAIKIKRVEYASENRTLTEGTAYIHFLPEGIVEEAVVHLATEDDSMKWTLAVHPITGKVDLLAGDIPLKEIRDQ